MLVIDRVELVLLHEPQEMREFERDVASRLQDRGDSADEIVDVGHLRQDVVADDEIGRRELRRERPSEEPGERFDAAFLRRLRDVLGGIDAEHLEAARDEELQEVAVIARQLDDAAVAAEPEPLDRHRRIAPRMLDPGLGI